MKKTINSLIGMAVIIIPIFLMVSCSKSAEDIKPIVKPVDPVPVQTPVVTVAVTPTDAMRKDTTFPGETRSFSLSATNSNEYGFDPGDGIASGLSGVSGSVGPISTPVMVKWWVKDAAGVITKGNKTFPTFTANKAFITQRNTGKKWKMVESVYANMTDSLSDPTTFPNSGIMDDNAYTINTDGSSITYITSGPIAGAYPYPAGTVIFSKGDTHLYFPDEKKVEAASAAQLILSQVHRLGPNSYRKFKWTYNAQ